MNIFSVVFIMFFVGTTSLVLRISVGETLLFYANFTNPAFYFFVITLYFVSLQSNKVIKAKKKVFATKFKEAEVIQTADEIFSFPQKEETFYSNKKMLERLKIKSEEKEAEDRQKKADEQKRKEEEKKKRRFENAGLPYPKPSRSFPDDLPTKRGPRAQHFDPDDDEMRRRSDKIKKKMDKELPKGKKLRFEGDDEKEES